MPQVSKARINEKIFKRIEKILLDSVLALKDGNEAFEFLNALLTPTERTMVTKRLSIAILLAKGYDYGSIKNILKVSQGTISSVKGALARSGEGYQRAIRRVLSEEKMKKLFLTIDALFDILPPKGGNWSAWGKRKWERKIEKQSPLLKFDDSNH